MNQPTMNLDTAWSWEKRKILVRQESGNPGFDDLRERLAELAGVNLKDLLDDMKKDTAKKKSITGKRNATMVSSGEIPSDVMAVATGQTPSSDYEATKKYKEILHRSHIVDASQAALGQHDTHSTNLPATVTAKNVKKKFFGAVPKSPPKRVALEIQREMAKPIIIPNPEETKAASIRLQRKLAKQRAARKSMAAGDGGDEVHVEPSSEENTPREPDVRVPKWEKEHPISAEGELEGMLYLSRMADSVHRIMAAKQEARAPGSERYEPAKQKQKEPASSEASVNKETSSTDPNSIDKKRDEEKGSSFSGVLGGAKVGVDTYNSSDMDAKLYCAKALCNWTRNPTNAQRLAKEGAIRALMHLALEPIPKILFYCAGAFRFMSENLVLATTMIDESTIPVIADIIKAGINDDNVVGNLTITLVNLTRVNGREGQVVEAMIHQALTNILTSHPELSPSCARGLYNLTCVDNSYSFIEKVVRALIQLASGSTTTNVKHICAAALCNLADMKTVRLRLVEEGVISVLSILAKGSETRTRRICAVILQNLSQSKSCRVEMVSRSAVQAAHMLSADTDPIILRCIGLTISRLSSEPANSYRIIHELGIAALCNIAVKFPTIPGITQPIATSFQLLSIIQSARVAVVQEGAVAALAAMLKNSVDVYTIQHCLLSLCNLLTEAENHLAIVQQGLIATLIYLTDNENDTIRDYCALAFLNLSLSDESRKHAVNAGATIAIIELSKAFSPPMTKARCAAAIMNLATAPFRDVSFVTVVLTPVMERMVADGAIVALVDLISVDDIATVRYACAALCRLCVTPASGMMIMESGAIPTLVQRAIEGEPQTQQYCGAVLSSLSCYEACRVQLFEMNCVAALKKLAEIDDDVTKQRCLSAFANLSCEESIQLRLIEQKVVGIISDLADSYHETTYIYCTRALCNLACAEGGRLRVATEGGMRALLMISMVRSVDVQTKYWCVVALCNLLDVTSIDYMLTEGLVASTAKLSRNGSNDDTIHTCARIFNFLSSHAPARLRIIEKASTLHALYSMMDSSDNETRILAARTTSNLLFSAETRDKAIEAGALHTLQAGIVSGNEDASLHCLKALFSACKQQPLMPIIAKTSIPMALCKFASECLSIDRHDLAVKCLVLLAWNLESRESLIKRTFADAFMQLVVQNLQSSSLENFALILRYLCVSYVRREELIAANVLSAISFVYHADPVLNPPPPATADPLARPVTPEGSIHRIGTSSFVFVRETRPTTSASRERGDVRPSSSESPSTAAEGPKTKSSSGGGKQSIDSENHRGEPSSSSQGDGNHKNGIKLMDHGVSRTVGSRGKESEGGDNVVGSSRESSSKRAGRISNRATMDSKPSSRRPSFEKKTMPIRASFESKAYTLPIIQAFLNAPAFSTVKNSNNTKCLAAAIRALATEPLCTETMASTNTITMLKSIGDSCNREPTVIYDIAVALYRFASHSPASRLATSSANTVAVLQLISSFPECTELCIVTICQYLTDPRSRKVFANREIITIVLGVLETSRQNDVLFNGITSLYLLSQRADCIAILAEPALQSDMHILRLSKSEDKKIQANCIRTLKNMSSDSSETIAEGAVASLLSMYFEDHIFERFEEDQFKPNILPISADDKRAPACIKEEIVDCLWYSEKVVISGGAAGKGPNPPEPPTTDMDENASDNHVAEEPDTADLDSRTKMCFAKMQTSQSLRDQCLLTDIDFVTVRDGPDDDEWLIDDEDSAADGLEGHEGGVSSSPHGLSRRSPRASFAPSNSTGTLIVSRPTRGMIIDGGDGRGGSILKHGQTSPLMTPSTATTSVSQKEMSSDQPAVTQGEDDKDDDKKGKQEDARGAARIRGVNLSVSTSNESSNNNMAIHSQINSPAPVSSQSKPPSNSKTPKKLRNAIHSTNTKRNTGMMGFYTTGINGMMSPGGTMMTVTSDVDEPYSPIQQQLAALEGPKLTVPGSGYGKHTPSKRETMSTLGLYN